MMKPVQYLLFDMSGTIRNDLSAVYGSMRDVFLHFGKKPPTLQQYRRFASPDYQRFYLKKDFTQAEIAEVGALFSKIFHSKYEKNVSMFPDTRLTMKNLVSEGKTLGIVSNIPIKLLRNHIKEYRLKKFMSVVMGREQGGDKSPSAQSVKNALEILGVRPRDSCYVGDQIWDIKSAHSAGSFAVAISRRGSYHTRDMLLAAKPDTIITALSELLEPDLF